MKRPDLLVAGGGPAGSVLALLAARAGLRVRLVDRDRFPRDKVCGEFLSAEGCAVLRRAGLLDELAAAGGVPMESCVLTDLAGKPLRLALPELRGGGRSALGISRRHLDAFLLQRAAEAGADVRTETDVRGPLLEHGRVAGLRVRGRAARGDGEALRATVVVAADGRRSALGRGLDGGAQDPWRTTPASWFGLRTHLPVSGIRAEPAVELHLFCAGYAGIAPVEGDRLNLCLLVRVGALRACGGSPARLLAERLVRQPALRERLGPRPETAGWCAVGPLRFNTRRTSAAGALFVGDAAGTVDPFCGEGMSNALAGAELLAPHVVRAVRDGAVDREVEAAWARDWRRAFAGAARRGRLLGGLLQRPRLAAALLALLRGPARGLAPRLVAASRTAAAVR